MNDTHQQEAVNLLAEASQRLGNHLHFGLTLETANSLMNRINKFLAQIEDETGMRNIPYAL